LREKAKDKNNKIITQSYAKKRKDTQRFLWVGQSEEKQKIKAFQKSNSTQMTQTLRAQIDTDFFEGKSKNN
jgi:hypothetical protein